MGLARDMRGGGGVAADHNAAVFVNNFVSHGGVNGFVRNAERKDFGVCILKHQGGLFFLH